MPWCMARTPHQPRALNCTGFCFWGYPLMGRLDRAKHGRIKTPSDTPPIAMPKAKLQAITVGGSAAEVEVAFYDALQKGDVAQLLACWADEDDIVCVHPGWARLIGAGAIRAAFEALLSHGAVPVHLEHVQCVEALASSVHSVIERIEIDTPAGRHEAWVIATNVYHKTAQGWRMVAHHASPGTPHKPLPLTDGPAVLH